MILSVVLFGLVYSPHEACSLNLVDHGRGYLGILLSCMIAEMAIIWLSMRGGILYTEPRESMQYVLYVRLGKGRRAAAGPLPPPGRHRGPPPTRPRPEGPVQPRSARPGESGLSGAHRSFQSLLSRLLLRASTERSGGHGERPRGRTPGSLAVAEAVPGPGPGCLSAGSGMPPGTRPGKSPRRLDRPVPGSPPGPSQAPPASLGNVL